MLSVLEKNQCATCENNCCTNFFIILEDVKDKDWIKWLSFHKGVKINKLESNKIQVWFDLPCENLTEDKACKIYKNRPEVCRKFACPNR